MYRVRTAISPPSRSAVSPTVTAGIQRSRGRPTRERPDTRCARIQNPDSPATRRIGPALADVPKNTARLSPQGAGKAAGCRGSARGTGGRTRRIRRRTGNAATLDNTGSNGGRLRHTVPVANGRTDRPDEVNGGLRRVTRLPGLPTRCPLKLLKRTDDPPRATIEERDHRGVRLESWTPRKGDGSTINRAR